MAKRIRQQQRQGTRQEQRQKIRQDQIQQIRQRRSQSHFYHPHKWHHCMRIRQEQSQQIRQEQSQRIKVLAERALPHQRQRLVSLFRIYNARLNPQRRKRQMVLAPGKSGDLCVDERDSIVIGVSEPQAIKLLVELFQIVLEFV